MSDAAVEATRLAPAGRACSKFVWQSRFLENWAVRMPQHSGRPAFLTINNVHTRITNRRRLRRSVLLCRFDLQASSRALLKCVAWRPPAAEMTVPTFGATPAPAPNAAGWPRSCRDWASLLAGEKGGRAADGESQLSRSRVAFAGLAGPEFVIEFETKRDQ
jgi:hypothetical protein